MEKFIIIPGGSLGIEGICRDGTHSHRPVEIFIPVRIIGTTNVGNSATVFGFQCNLCKAVYREIKFIGAATVSYKQSVFTIVGQGFKIVEPKRGIKPTVVFAMTCIVNESGTFRDISQDCAIIGTG